VDCIFINNLLIKIIVLIKCILSPYKLPCWLYGLRIDYYASHSMKWSILFTWEQFHLTRILINVFIHCWYTNICLSLRYYDCLSSDSLVATTKQRVKWFHLLDLHVITPNCKSLVLTIENINVKCSTYWNYNLLHKKVNPLFYLRATHESGLVTMKHGR
jgi:hypothetical protein